MKKLFLTTVCISFSIAFAFAQSLPTTMEWPVATIEMKPAARWWWMGSAVDTTNLTYNLSQYAAAGMGTMEITPIYGVQNNEANDTPFLSARWMEMLKHTQSQATRLGIQIDMNTGTGWPFGGPEVTIEDAASCLVISEYKLLSGERLTTKIAVDDPKQQPFAQLSKVMAFEVNAAGARTKRVVDVTDKVTTNSTLTWKAPATTGAWRIIATFCGKTQQKVKRAAPGGVGYVMDHLSARAVGNYLNRFTTAFATTQTSYPHNFFNDSYEVYGGDWTANFFEEFATRRGYKLQEYLPEFLSADRTEITTRIVADYRETIAELLLDNFTHQWTNWAHSHGSKTRNQAHGSPGNLIDLYATVDVPECEGFGLSDFGIKGLRKDSLTRPNDSDLSMLKYASSGAHIAGKPYTSAETFTWLTEHFRTSLSQCKPDIDLLFLSGVNHTYFHGTTYSPKEAAWPGWKFYASIDMSPTNTIWRDAPAFFSYITRCQSFLQSGKPDNDFLVYLPVYDMWSDREGRLLMFDIHKMAERAPTFIAAVNRIYQAGYDMDYTSDNFIRTATCVDGKIVTSGGATYKALVIPGVRLMPHDVVAKLFRLAEEGATIVFLDHYPTDVPGYANLEVRRAHFAQLMAKKDKLVAKGKVLFGTDYAQTLAQTAAQPELMKTQFGLSSIRRTNDSGYHYFIAALNSQDHEGWIPLSIQATSAVIFDPLTGNTGKAKLRQADGQTQVYLQLASGASLILKTFTTHDVPLAAWKYYQPDTKELLLGSKWGFRFVESTPTVAQTPDSVSLGSWTELPVQGVAANMGTAAYTTTFCLDGNPALAGQEYQLNLGDVRESARITINGTEVTTLWSLPYRCLIGRYLRPDQNVLTVEVTNLPANRIAAMDRNKQEWRIFKEINLVDRNYEKRGYGHWQPMPSGLLGPVSIKLMREVENQ